MNNLLVYLHGFGFDKTNNHELVYAIAKSLNAEVLALDAPFASERDRGGFAWYRVQKNPKMHIYDDKVDFSADFIIKEVNKKLNEMELDWSNVVLCGRSQGAFMAMYLALSGKVSPQKVISLCGFYPDEMLNKVQNKNVPIVWVEALNDTVLIDEKKNSYKKLVDIGCNLKHVVDKNSDHDILNNSIVDIINTQ